ncbi:hypothetical protein KOR34_43010 [Posidoniimonas corsicana]|uniref:Uncharacterized protein n=2 Tax=Posidoniimonas corsicana TaxID=1938618 RepID=A0A5C5V237_9BACT|nr:hypothetical protein KOR34_43010 [Posidoniimonas corsicana]
MKRFGTWFGASELMAPTPVAFSEVVPLSCDENGQWRGLALYVYSNACWTVFEDLTGAVASTPAADWLGFSEADEFIYAGYNDAIGYGEFVHTRDANILREYLYVEDDPSANIDRGYPSDTAVEPLTTWIEVARFVDDDELACSEKGLLWILGPGK